MSLMNEIVYSIIIIIISIGMHLLSDIYPGQNLRELMFVRVCVCVCVRACVCACVRACVRV